METIDCPMDKICMVKVGVVSDVQPHPESDKLDIVTISNKINVANRPISAQPRYKIGDFAVVLPENLILPDELIKHLDMWNHVKNKGGLAGNKGNRTKARKIAGILSEVALCAIEWSIDEVKPILEQENHVLEVGTISISKLSVHIKRNKIVNLLHPVHLSPEGYNMAWCLGIKDYTS